MLREREWFALLALASAVTGFIACSRNGPGPSLVEGPSEDVFVRTGSVGGPSFPGATFCSFVVEPQQPAYKVDQQIFFTATQVAGDNGFPIARYDWDFGTGSEPGDTASGRDVSYVYAIAALGGTVFQVTLSTTEALTGSQSACSNSLLVYP